MTTHWKRFAALALLLGALPLATSAAPMGGKEPIFIGAQACGACHDGPDMGRQFSTWRLSAHAKAYAVLALPESKEIVRLSGITEEPHKAKMCLGCHATAAEAENWEKADGFHLEDGLQCEACHGAGSEYAPMDIMKERMKAMMSGLRMPKKDDCMMCHRAKGSHDAVLKKKPFDLERAWEAIAHHTPKGNNTNSQPAAVPPPASPFKFTGVMACAACHSGPMFNFQFSVWRLSGHAQAYVTLATPKALEMAKASGVMGDPQKCGQCLKCHTTGQGLAADSFLKGFDPRDGVQCEACHGPGSDYSPEAIMRDKAAARAKGLWAASAKTCQPCHENAHDMKFDYDMAVKKIAHPRKVPQTAASEPAYKNPLNLALTPDGRELWGTCEASASVVIVDTATRQKVAELPVGGQPNDVCFTPDGKQAFVSNRLDDNVSVVDVAARKVTGTLPAGDEPHGVLVDRQGKRLYVLNTPMDSISVFDVAALKEVKRLSASRSPWSLAQSPDGKFIFLTHALSRFVPDRTPSMSEVTVIDAERVLVEDRLVVKAANLLQGIAWHPSGDFALITLLRTKNLVPMTRINHGWTISNGLGVLWRDGTIDQVLLDQNHLYFPDPSDVCIMPDGRYALVTSSSSDRVAVVDLAKLTALLKAASAHERERVIPNHLGKSAEFVVAHIPTQTCPKGITCSADGATAYVACMLDDSVTVLDLTKLEVAGRVDLGGSKELSIRRRGEKLFHNANITFRRQFSCSTCHPDGHIDNIVYDIEDDGIGMGPIDNRTLRGINDMAPYKWTGINPSLKRQCGPRLAVFITRIQPFTPEQMTDLHYYLCSILRPPNRYRALGEDLTEAQRRGKAIFERIEIPWMTPGDLDPTYIETNIPWVFRCIGDDRQQNYILVDYLFRKLNYQRLAIFRASNRYGRFGVREIRDGARRLERPIVIEMAHKVGATNFTMQLERIEAAKPEAIVYWGDAVDAGNVLNAIRARSMKQPIYFCDRAVSDEFLKIAGQNAEGIVCSYPWNPDRQDPKLDAFKAAFKQRWGVEPDTYAAHAYDGINMLIWAIQTAGLNRAKIRDVLAYRAEPFPGVTGDIPLSSALDDAGEVFLARRENGQWKYYSRADWGIPRGKVIEKMRVEREQASRQ